MLFKNCCLTLMGRIVKKKTSLATPFRLLVSPTIFSVSMHYHYIYVLQISDLLLPHRTCCAIPVTVRLLNKDRFTGLKFSMCLNKNIDVIWYHNVDPSGHPRKTQKLINIFQISGRPQLGEFKAIHSTIIFVFGSPKSRSSSFQTVNRGYYPPLDENFQPI